MVHEDPQKIIETFRMLGITPEELARIQATPFPKSLELLTELQASVKKTYRRLAFELHPDRTGNDAAKADLFKTLTRVAQHFERITIAPPPPPPPPPVVTWIQAIGTLRPGLHSQTTVTVVRMDAHAVVFMRPVR